MAQQGRFSNRAIIGYGVVLCIVAAAILAYFFGLLEHPARPP
jgi:hypothetical protein